MRETQERTMSIVQPQRHTVMSMREGTKAVRQLILVSLPTNSASVSAGNEHILYMRETAIKIPFNFYKNP